jgi:hypothetical protein
MRRYDYECEDGHTFEVKTLASKYPGEEIECEDFRGAMNEQGQEAYWPCTAVAKRVYGTYNFKFKF